jgi:hypothetical protein
MTSQISDIEAEAVELAEAEGEHMGMQEAPLTTGVPGMGMRFIEPQDRGAWVAGWQLKVDRFGNEYGVPCRIPRGQGGLWLAKRRPDGGRRFTLREPANVQAVGPFECFIGDCRKRTHTRSQLVGHIEAFHRVEALQYTVLLDELRAAVVADNPKLAALVSKMTTMPDEEVRAVSRVELGNYDCRDCAWKPKPNAKNPRFALNAHRRARHGGKT